MRDTVRVVLCGINGNDGVVASDGNRWRFGGFDGWDAPAMDANVVSLSGRHGVVSAERRARGRMILVRATVVCPTQDAAWGAYNLLTSGMPGLLDEGVLEVHEPTPKWVTVVQGAAPEVRPPQNRVVRADLALLAEYPFKRALVPVTVSVPAGGSASFSAAGSFPAEVSVELTSGGSLHLTAGGLSLVSEVSMAAGTVLDSLTRSVKVGGSSVYQQLAATSQWPAVVPGSNTFTNNGTASVDVTFFPTFA